MAAERAREGDDPDNAFGWPPTPVAIRKRIQQVYGTGCRSTTFAQNERAVADLYRVDLQPRYNLPYDTFRSLIIGGRGAVVAISYAVVHGTRFDSDPNFTGGHSIYVNERRARDGFYLVGDPLADGRRPGIPEGWEWWPSSFLKAAMFAYPGTDRGRLHASFTRDTE